MRFEIERAIHSDGRRVLLAAMSEDGRRVVIKKLTSENSGHTGLAGLAQEFKLLRELEIAGIPRALAVSNLEDGSPALILEDAEGIPLQEFVKEKAPTFAQRLAIAAAIAGILDRLHQKTVFHRDIKPANVVVNLETGQPQIIDLGLASRLSQEEAAICSPFSIVGSLPHIAPEQTGRMNRTVDYRADLYSFGVLLYELFTDILPFAMQEPIELVHAHLALVPEDPARIRPDLPPVIGRIILKLLSKSPEERYQSAAGVQADLERCLLDLGAGNRIADFVIAGRDFSEKFQIPQKLYGRDSEVERLLRGYDLVCEGSAKFVVVSGLSGIGKSALVHEVHKPLVATRGYFISGKCDQFKRNLPYSSLILAFQDLAKQILSEPSDEIEKWKDSLLASIAPNGGVLTDLIPEIELILGRQENVLELGATETRNRFNLTLTEFIKVIATAMHPVVLFLDDLQWSDSASLTLLEELLCGGSLRYLYLIGSYRDNEVGAGHPPSEPSGSPGSRWSIAGIHPAWSAQYARCNEFDRGKPEALRKGRG